MWLATGDIRADLSKTFSKKSLEIVLEAEILAPSEVSGFGKDKTPKFLDFTGFSVRHTTVPCLSLLIYSRRFYILLLQHNKELEITFELRGTIYDNL